jgi:hypothetical protein
MHQRQFDRRAGKITALNRIGENNKSLAQNGDQGHGRSGSVRAAGRPSRRIAGDCLP